MKVLYIGFGGIPATPFEVSSGTLGTSTPYGFDVIVVDPKSVGELLGQAGGVGITTVWNRWKETLASWLGSGHRMVVLMRPVNISQSHNNYSWLPLTNFNPTGIKNCGNSRHLGEIVAEDSYVKSYLKNDNGQFSVITHFHSDPNIEQLKVNSKVDANVLTSFSWKHGSTEVIFLPIATIESINRFLTTLDTSATRWKINKVSELEGQIQGVDSQIQTLEDSRKPITDQINQINTAVNNLVESDVYLRRAIDSFELSQASENPNPENFYEAIEAIEKAFSSEREMRETLNFSKTFIDTIMSRTNEFRHVARDGGQPTNLTAEEVSSFTQNTEQIIKSYIEYLYSM